ncbi:MAG: hypothetical protein WCF90_06990 [Methanomicrobiales archaeon]
MTEIKGHFKKGCWVLEKAPATPKIDENALDKRFSDATKSVINSIDDVVKVTRDLVTTEEGKQYIEKTILETQTQMQRSFDDMINRVKSEVEKQVKNLK